MISLAGASVGSGLAVGCVLDDKKNRKTKVKESISQMVGNMALPILCVTGGSIMAGQCLEKQLPLFKKITSTGGQRVFKIAASVLGFLAGLFGGNKIANKVNQVAFNTPKVAPKRGIKVADFSGHIDDSCATVALVGKGVKTCEAVARVIPAALTICGISTGLAKKEA